MAIKKIALITTAQPSTNPRLVKEADALTEAGYLVKVFYCYRSDWATELDRQLLPDKQWSYQLVGGSPKNRHLCYQWTRIRRKLAEILTFLPGSLPRALAQAFDELLHHAINSNADLFIAHNPGALPVAAIAAKRTNKIYAFDAEDFHSGELMQNHPKNKKIAKLEKKYLKGAAYITAASPMIALEYERKYDIKVQCINNTFPLALQPKFRSYLKNTPLKIFWFSQYIGRDRGIEDILQALHNIPEIPIEIGLLCSGSLEDKSYFQKMIISANHQLYFFAPLPEKELVQLCAQYDIGLALERKEPLNRDLCLTNKLFTYLLAGNAIIASATTSQKAFVEQYPNSGCYVYDPGDFTTLAQIIKNWFLHSESLNSDRQRAWSLAKTQLNWDVEKKTLVSKIKSIEKGSYNLSSLASI